VAKKRISAKKRKLNKEVSKNVKAIYKAGLRKNTQRPVSPKNKRRPISQKQAVAVAISMAKTHDHPLKTLPNKRINKWKKYGARPKH
jgi:hypothetical protein